MSVCVCARARANRLRVWGCVINNAARLKREGSTINAQTNGGEKREEKNCRNFLLTENLSFPVFLFLSLLAPRRAAALRITSANVQRGGRESVRRLLKRQWAEFCSAVSLKIHFTSCFVSVFKKFLALSQSAHVGKISGFNPVKGFDSAQWDGRRHGVKHVTVQRYTSCSLSYIYNTTLQFDTTWQDTIQHDMIQHITVSYDMTQNTFFLFFFTPVVPNMSVVLPYDTLQYSIVRCNAQNVLIRNIKCAIWYNTVWY